MLNNLVSTIKEEEWKIKLGAWDFIEDDIDSELLEASVENKYMLNNKNIVLMKRITKIVRLKSTM